jgi:hypothetical protein
VLPRAFTEHGAIMAATVLNSPQAVAMSIYVVRAFIRMREQLAANAAILKRLAEIDKTLLQHDAALLLPSALGFPGHSSPRQVLTGIQPVSRRTP